MDLLPAETSKHRLTTWVHSEVKEFCGLISPKENEEAKTQELREYGWIKGKDKEREVGVLRRSNVHLVSCQVIITVHPSTSIISE